MHIRENNDYDIDLNSKANIFEQRIYTVTLDILSEVEQSQTIEKDCRIIIFITIMYLH